MGRQTTLAPVNSGAKGIIFASEFLDDIKPTLSNLSHITVLGVTYVEGHNVQEVEEYPNLKEMLEGPEVPVPDINDDPLSPVEII